MSNKLVVVSFALVVSALFMLRVIQKTCYGSERTQFTALHDVPLGLAIPRMILLAFIVLLGLFPSLLLNVIETASVPFMNGF